MSTILHAIIAYFFLLLVVRVIGRRPGAQMTPFEFVLVFFIGGITIQAVVGEDHSLINAFSAISTVALLHAMMAWLKQRYAGVGKIMDGTPLILLDRGAWQQETMSKMRIQQTDVMEAARTRGLKHLGQIKYAILERNGGISIIAADPDSP